MRRQASSARVSGAESHNAPMSAISRAIAPFWVVALFASAPALAGAEIITGTVVGIADGDTVTVLDEQHRQHKVRLAGIDAPEKTQDFGNRSKRSLSELAYRRQVTVETTKADRYGRQVGKVIVAGQDVNLEQVHRGMAWHYKAYQQEQSPVDRQAYATAEDAARSAKAGLWVMRDPTPPSEFRRENREPASSRTLGKTSSLRRRLNFAAQSGCPGWSSAAEEMRWSRLNRGNRATE